MGPNLKAVKVVVSVGKCKNANNGWSFEADSTNYDSLEGWNIIMEFLHFDTFSDFFVFLLVCWFVSLLLFFFFFVFFCWFVGLFVYCCFFFVLFLESLRRVMMAQNQNQHQIIRHNKV